MKIPKYIIPILVVVALFGGYGLRTAFTQPTTNVSLGDEGGAKLDCIVDGVRCKGTANFFTMLYKDVPGISGIETFATERRAIFTYDPTVISPDQIRAIMEAPIPMRDGSMVQVFTCLSMEEK
ncbi:MAG: hypothetical protein JSV52_15290 [Candidatus Zixiibacteriota bacterium]|nr:MAG: hypothetical protein JSV52_15290 [candidate division Zixibacteria bacterium]